MLQHQQGQTPDGDSDPEDKSDQIGVKELCAIDQPAENKKREEQKADREREHAHSL
jgi:hypothetical protein